MTEATGRDELAAELGVEEEFFLVDPETRDLLSDPDRGIFEECERNSGPHKVVAEFLRAQIETTTRVCGTVAEVRSALEETRRLVIDAAPATAPRSWPPPPIPSPPGTGRWSPPASATSSSP